MSWRYTYANRLEQQNEKISGRHLQRILQYTMTPCRSLPTFKRSDCVVHNTDCDEVYPNLYVGDAASAKNKAFLRQIGITHILNTAEGTRFGQVDTGHAYYRDCPQIRYMGFPLTDHPSTDISRYFYIAAKFIDNGISSGGKVLVHCQMGISRSSTCALVYLMIYRKMTAADAIRTVRLRRDIYPNESFLQQLADLDNELRRERLYYRALSHGHINSVLHNGRSYTPIPPEAQRSSDLAPMEFGRKPKQDQYGRAKSKCYAALMKDLFFNR